MMDQADHTGTGARVKLVKQNSVQRYDRSDTCGEFRLNRLRPYGEVHALEEGDPVAA